MHRNKSLNFGRIFSGLSIVLLTACASSGPALQRYMLPAEDELPAAAEQAQEMAMSVAPVQLSGLVDRRGLLMQTSLIQVHEANGHQWAEPLGPQLQRSLQRHMAAQLPNYQIQPLGQASSLAPVLIVQVDQFQGRFDGLAVVSGNWQILDNKRQIVQGQPFLLKQPLQDNGYPALVHSLHKAWQQLAGQIATAVSNDPS
ncbi:MAG: PqiC family protein [Oceanococcus sp.]